MELRVGRFESPLISFSQAETPCTDLRYLLFAKPPLGTVLNGRPYIIVNEESWARVRGGNGGLPTRRQLQDCAASNFITADEMGQTGHTPRNFQSAPRTFARASFLLLFFRCRARRTLLVKAALYRTHKKDNEYFGR